MMRSSHATIPTRYDVSRPVARSGRIGRIWRSAIALIASMATAVALAPAAQGANPLPLAEFPANPGAAAALVFDPPLGVSGSVTAGTSIFAEPHIVDADGNPITNGYYTIGLAAIQYDGTDHGGTYNLVDLSCTTNVDGIEVSPSGDVRTYKNSLPAWFARFSCDIDKAGAAYALLAVASPVAWPTSPGRWGDGTDDPQVLTGVSEPFAVTAGAASKFVFLDPPSGGQAGESFYVQPRVAVTDNGGNLIADTPVSVELSAISRDGQVPGDLTCGGQTGEFPSAETVDGIATFADCRMGVLGQWTVTAQSTIEQDSLRLNHATADITISDTMPSNLSFQPQPLNTPYGNDGVAGQPFDVQPGVTVKDADGRSVSGLVSLGLADSEGKALPNGSTATLSCLVNPAVAAAGAVTFTRCSVSEAGDFTLVATVDGFHVTSSSFTIDAAPDTGGTGDNNTGDTGNTGDDNSGDDGGTGDTGGSTDTPIAAPASIAFTAQPGSAAEPGLLAASPTVTIFDDDDAPFTAAPVTVSLAVTDDNAAIICSPGTVTTTSGQAIFTGCVVDKAGTYTLTATAGDLTVTSDSFTVGEYSMPSGNAPKGQPVGQTFGGQDWSTNPTAVTNDVNTATGSLTFGADDLTVAGLGFPLQVTRMYQSADTVGGAFGTGWSSIFDAGVTIKGKTALVRGEDGAQLTFTQHGSGLLCLLGLCGWDAPPGARASLSCVLTLCAITRDDGTIMTSLNGKTLSITSPTLQGIAFSYSGGTLKKVHVANSTKEITVDVTTNSAKHITKLTTPTRTVSYRYDGNLLVGATDTAGKETTYRYSGARLHTVTDPSGTIRLTADYDSSGRVTSVKATGGPDRFDDTYQYGGGATTRESALAGGRNATFVDRYVGNVLVSQQLPTGTGYVYEYDAQLGVTKVTGPRGDVTTYTYNNNGDRTSTTSPTGDRIRYGFDGSHHVTSVTDPDGNVTRFTWAFGLLTSITPPTGTADRTTYSYNLRGEQTKEKSPGGTVTYRYDGAGNQIGMVATNLDGSAANGEGPVLTYDEAGHVLTAVDPRGHHGKKLDAAYATIYRYDAAGRLTATTQPGGVSTSTGYNVAGDVTSTTAPNGVKTSYTWDEDALTSTATAGSKTVSERTFDPSGNLLTETDGGGRTTTNSYDAAGRLGTSRSPSGLTTSYLYNAADNLIGTQDSSGRSATYGYDVMGNPTVQYLGGVRTSAVYNPAGQLMSLTDADGTTSYGYAPSGALASLRTAVGTTSYRYNAAGNLVAVVDGAGHETSYAYDVMGRQIAMAVGGAQWNYRWDVAGNLAEATDPDGRKTSYQVDARGLRTGITYQQGDQQIAITQAFDELGRRTSMTDPVTGIHTYTYDDAGNLTSATTGTGTFAGRYHYDYSAPGVVTETYPDGTEITTKYDDVHLVMGVSSGSVTASYLRDAGRRVTGLVYSNGLVTTQGYDAAGRVSSQRIACGAATVSTTRYGYTAAGNPLGSVTEAGGLITTTGYGYDGTGRLTGQSSTVEGTPTDVADCLGGSTTPATGDTPDDLPALITAPTVTAGLDLEPATAHSIGYDAAGNRTSVSGATYGYNGADELVSATDGSSATYDGAGNMTGSTDANGTTTSYAYDAANRLASVTLPNGRTVAYAYDGDGNRVSRTVDATTTVYRWDISAAIPLLTGEYSADSTMIRRYFYGDGPVAMQTAEGTYFYHTNTRGDVVALSDATGKIVSDYRYDAFGTVTAIGEDTGNPLLFQGQLVDADTGLYDMRARNYDPATGRFTQPDPIPAQVGTAAVSRYAFAANSPVALGDPSGQIPAGVQRRGTELVDRVVDDPGGSALWAVNKLAYGDHSTSNGRNAHLAKRSVQATKFALKGGIAVAKRAGVLSEVGAAGIGTKLSRGAAVIGFGLGVYYTVEDCQHGPVEKCVASAVSTAVGLACDVLTEGAGAVACTLASVALAEVIERYGPQIAAYAVDLAGYIAAGAPGVLADVGSVFEEAGASIGTAFTEAGNTAAHPFTEFGSTVAAGAVGAVGTVSTGLNTAGAGISSGLNDAVDALVDAGYTAGQLAGVFGDLLGDGAEETLDSLLAAADSATDAAQILVDQLHASAELIAAKLTELGYEIAEIAEALVTVVEASAEDVIAAMKSAGYAAFDIALGLKDTAEFTVDEVAAGLKNVYGQASDVAAVTLAAAGYGLDQVASGLSTAYGETAGGIAVTLAGIGYGASQVADALESLSGMTIGTAASALKAAGYAIDQVATGLQGAYADVMGTASAVASVLQQAGYGATEVARGLQSVFYSLTASQAAAALKGAGFAAEQTANALRDAYFYTSAQLTAAVLKGVGYTVGAVAGVLTTVYHVTDAVAGSILSAVGYASSAIHRLGGAFASFGNSVADGFASVGNTIASWF